MTRPHDGRFGDMTGTVFYDREGHQIDPKTRKRVEGGGQVDPKTGADIRPPLDLRTGKPVGYSKPW